MQQNTLIINRKAKIVKEIGKIDKIGENGKIDKIGKIQDIVLPSIAVELKKVLLSEVEAFRG
ncbi:MAG: hypothetical protein AAGA77_22000 [Bacteroidota bacterium]